MTNCFNEKVRQWAAFAAAIGPKVPMKKPLGLKYAA